MDATVQPGHSAGQLDHIAVIASLPDDTRAGLLARSDAAGLRHLALHLTAIAATGAVILTGPALLAALAVPLHGILLVFLFTLLHEVIHHTAFRTLWINKAIANACGFILFLPPQWFRYLHFAHHRHTNDPAHDPEIVTPRPSDWRGYLQYLSGIPLWLSQWRALLVNATGRNADAFVPERGKAKVRREARVMLALYALLLAASLAASSTLLAWLWIVPVFVGQPFLRAYLLAEHALCPQTANMFANTRTTFSTRLVRALAWNMPFHAEHHAYPAVPFHQLPRFHDICRGHLQVTDDGYASFHLKFMEEKLKPPHR